MQEVLRDVSALSSSPRARGASRELAAFAFAIAGPLCLGVVGGLRAGDPAVLLQRAIGLPLVMLGTALLMAPALYLLLALGRAPATAGELARKMMADLSAAGLSQLGLAPAVLFMAVTTAAPTTGLVLVVVAFATGILIGVRRLVLGLLHDDSGRRLATLLWVLPWCAAAAIVGGRLTVEWLRASGL